MMSNFMITVSYTADRDLEQPLFLAAGPVAGQPRPPPPAPGDRSDDPESRPFI
jgi:hypothetical protein